MRKKVYTRQVGVLFSKDTYAELIRITDELEISVSEYIRRIVETKLKNENEEDICNEHNRKINRTVTGTFPGFSRTD